jgi:hypothetical protein
MNGAQRFQIGPNRACMADAPEITFEHHKRNKTTNNLRKQ